NGGMETLPVRKRTRSQESGRLQGLQVPAFPRHAKLLFEKSAPAPPTSPRAHRSLNPARKARSANVALFCWPGLRSIGNTPLRVPKNRTTPHGAATTRRKLAIHLSVSRPNS